MRLVVIGGVAAGLSAAARARRLDKNLEIVVLEKGPVISYGACGLPYYIEGRVPSAADLQIYSSERFQRERFIEIRTGTAVEEIRHPRRELFLKKLREGRFAPGHSLHGGVLNEAALVPVGGPA